MELRRTADNERSIVMGFLNIIGYIGVGLLAAGIFLLASYYLSRPKKTYLYKDGNIGKARGNGSWNIAFGFALFGFCIITALLLINLTRLFIIISIVLGVLAGVALNFLFFMVSKITEIITRKPKVKLSVFNRIFFISTAIICLLNGAGFAILTYIWGWFWF